MADRFIDVIEPATNFALLTLEELKVMLAITDTTSDAQLTQMIDWYSAYVSQITNRVFAREKVRETWYELQGNRLFLSHWPVKKADIESVECPEGSVLDPTSYKLEERSGKLALRPGSVDYTLSAPIVVTYTGGLNLPDEAPDDLKNAAALMVRQGRTEAQREATAGIRSISHKDSRVMFFDPASGGGGSGGGGNGSAVESIRAIHALLYHYSRLEV